MSTVAPEALSPELALVDDELAAAARRALGDPGSIRGATTAVRPDAPAAAHGHRSAPDARLIGTISRVPRSSVAVAICALALAALVLGGPGLRSGAPTANRAAATARQRPVPKPPPRPVAAPAATSGARSVPKSATRARRSTPQPSNPAPVRASGPRGRDVVRWARAPGATAYRVELFQRTRRVFSADTTAFSYGLPTSWLYEGRRYRLAGGHYRLYVWAAIVGRPSPEPVVRGRRVSG